jgi:hypothetical protein
MNFFSRHYFSVCLISVVLVAFSCDVMNLLLPFGLNVLISSFSVYSRQEKSLQTEVSVCSKEKKENPQRDDSA